MNIDETDEKNNVGSQCKACRTVNPRDRRKELIRVLQGFVCFNVVFYICHWIIYKGIQPPHHVSPIILFYKYYVSVHHLFPTKKISSIITTDILANKTLVSGIWLPGVSIITSLDTIRGLLYHLSCERNPSPFNNGPYPDYLLILYPVDYSFKERKKWCQFMNGFIL